MTEKITKAKNNNGLGPELMLSKIPTQKRAQKTVERILETASQLIQVVGIEGFNTNLLAKRADINIATLYRYFPNKTVILNALFQKWQKQVELLLVEMEDLADPARDWRELFDLGVNSYIAMTNEQPGYMDLRRAMQADPELRNIEQSTNRVLAETIATLLKERGLQLPEKRFQAVARSFIEMVATLIDSAWMEDREYSEELLGEMKVIYHSYLANYLD